MTADVITLRPTPLHYASCDRDVYGRAVMHMLSSGAAVDITSANLRLWVRGWRETQPCDCLSLRVKNVEGRLERARKAWESCATDDNADRVAFLRGELARLRGMA